MAIDERHRADGVFEGGGVKGIAFAGAIAPPEEEAGVQECVNLAGTSAGSICASLLVVGYRAADLQRILSAKGLYPKFPDWGPAREWLGGGFDAILRLRGLAPGRFFEEWLSEQIAAPILKTVRQTFAKDFEGATTW